MLDDNLALLEAWDLAGRIARREVSPVEAVEATLAQIARLEPRLNAYITILDDEALAAARRLGSAGDSGSGRPLWGLPIAVKDNIATAGVRTTAGSGALRDYIPSADAEVARRLRQNGAIMIGKANLYEFAFAAPHPLYGPVLNPWDSRVATGGSSSGSACAVSAGLCSASIGTDTGGSIRIPAAFCGVVGLKPTYGAVSCSGVIPVSPSLDHVGPLTRSVHDAALIFEAIRDPVSHSRQDGAADRTDDGARGLRLGVVPDAELGDITPEVAAAYEAAQTVLAAQGATISEIALPRFDVARSVMRILATVDLAEQERSRLHRHPKAYGDELRDFLASAAAVPAVAYRRAGRIRELFRAGARAAFDAVDGVLLPTVPIPPFTLGATSVSLNGRQQDTIKLMTQFTTLFNVVGYPAISIPASVPAGSLPIGIQIVARPHEEATLFRIGLAYERQVGMGATAPAATAP